MIDVRSWTTNSWVGGISRISGERKKRKSLSMQKKLGDMERKQKVQDRREVMPHDRM